MKRLNYLLIVIFSLCCFSLDNNCLAQNKDKLKVTGVVIGFDRFASLTNISSAPQLTTIIVKLDKLNKSKQNQNYAIVIYKNVDKQVLPEEIFDGKRKWEFRLVRDSNCDSTLKEITSLKTQENQSFAQGSRFEWTSLQPNIDNDTKLPCYLLGKNDYKLLKK